jgi:hypothetical protein
MSKLDSCHFLVPLVLLAGIVTPHVTKTLITPVSFLIKC